jgi:hypothetical protein
MTTRMPRRLALLGPLLLAACGDEDVPAPAVRRDFPALRYGYLPAIRLSVAHVDMGEDFVPPSGGGEIIGASPADPVETLQAMARDRLKPEAAGGVATFRIQAASIVRDRDTLNGRLAVRLEVHDADDTNSGFAEARVTATHTGPIQSQRAAVYDMLKSMMDDMNVELEYQLRNKLRAWVVDTPAEAPSAPRPADPLIRSPPPPPRS